MPNSMFTDYDVTIWRTDDNMDLKTWTFIHKDEAIAKRNACVYGAYATETGQGYYHEYYVTVTCDGFGDPCGDIDTFYTNDIDLTD